MPSTVIDALRREHANMRSVLVLIGQELDKLERDNDPNYVLLANGLYYMRKFPSLVHHPKEDLIFERLAAADGGYKQEVERVRKQHQEIYEFEDWLIELALNTPKRGSTAATRLRDFGRHYLQTQREHSETEERVLFPRALQVLTGKDWAAVSRESQQVNDPLFGEHGGERYQLLYDHIMRESSMA
jgi:hemerythrin-like domain-containing protein